jgi:hypothetical protein
MGESSEGIGQGNMNFSIPNPEPSSLEGEVRNMTGVMVQLLSRIEAQDQRVLDIQNYIKNPSAQPTSALGGATASTLDNQLIHNLPSGSNAHSQLFNPTLQDFRADPTLVSQATRQLSELDDDNMGRFPSNNVAN